MAMRGFIHFQSVVWRKDLSNFVTNCHSERPARGRSARAPGVRKLLRRVKMFTQTVAGIRSARAWMPAAWLNSGRGGAVSSPLARWLDSRETDGRDANPCSDG